MDANKETEESIIKTLKDIKPSEVNKTDKINIMCALRTEFDNTKGYEIYENWEIKEKKDISEEDLADLISDIGKRWDKNSARGPLPLKTIQEIAIGRGITKSADKVEVAKSGEFTPADFNRYAIVKNSNTVIDLNDKSPIKKMTFNNRHKHLSNKGRIDVMEKALRLGMFKEFSYMAYHPGKDSTYIDSEGREVLNSYKQSSRPIPATRITTKGKKALELWHKHLKELFNSEEKATIILDWISWIVQNPGKLIGWCPVLIGTKGCGKSIIFNSLLSAVIGETNKRDVTPADIDKFNNWAAESQVIVFNELMIPKQSRNNTANQLKQLITEKRVRINKKYQDSRDIENVTNYVATTNCEEPLPMDESERRYCVLRCIKTQEDFLKKDKYYFHKLAAASDNNTNQLVSIFKKRKITTFEEFMGAPKTDDRDNIIEDEKRRVVGYEEALDYISKHPTRPNAWNDKIIIPTRFFKALKEEESIIPNPLDKNKIMNSLGYKFKSPPIKFDKSPETIRVSESSLIGNSKKIRRLLSETVCDTII